MRRKSLLWILLSASLVVLMSAGSVFAAGFALYEGGARGLVLGAGLTATADDASAVFYNPAGITQLKGVHTMFGATAINPMVNVKTNGQITAAFPSQVMSVTGTEDNTTGFANNWFFPPHAYYTQQLSDRLYLGAGVFTRFGLGTEYPTTWPGRYNSYNARIQTLEFNPNLAYKVSDKFSIAGGLNVTWLDLTLQKKAAFNYALGTSDVDVDLNGDAYGWGLNLAAHYKPVDWLSAGISYRSRVSIHMDHGGTVNFTKPALPAGVPAPIVAAYGASFNDTSASGDIRLPDMVFAGLAVKPIKKVTVGGGVFWTRWSTYDQLVIDFEDPITATGVKQSKAKKNWDDVFRYYIGVEWNVTDWMDLRLGYAYDENPVPDNTISYELPDSDRQYFSLGCGFHRGNWTLDLAYMYLLFDDRDIDARGAEGVLDGKVEDGYAHLISLSFGYKF